MNKHGGKRKGSDRPKGSRTKEPTKVMRVPLSLVPKVEKLIQAHLKSPSQK